jgi:hypothetical protein
MKRRDLCKSVAAVLIATGLRKPAEPELTFRKTERNVNGKWSPIEFEHMRMGDVMRFTDTPDKAYFVNGDPKPCEPKGNFVVEMIPYSTNEALRISSRALGPGEDTGEADGRV